MVWLYNILWHTYSHKVRNWGRHHWQAFIRGGKLGGKGAVVVKFSKPTQDLRFDVPTIGTRTLETMIAVNARVLAVEAGCSLILDKDELIPLANKHKISIIGCKSLR